MLLVGVCCVDDLFGVSQSAGSEFATMWQRASFVVRIKPETSNGQEEAKEANARTDAQRLEATFKQQFLQMRSTHRVPFLVGEHTGGEHAFRLTGLHVAEEDSWQWFEARNGNRCSPWGHDRPVNKRRCADRQCYCTCTLCSHAGR